MTRLSIKPQRHHGYFIAALMAIAFVGIISLFMHKAHAESPAAVAGEHVITLHDDGVDKGFITKAKTLREAFAGAGIRIDANDRTEPGLDEQLVAGSYDVNIYRARPVVIRDGSRETKIITAYRTGRQIADQAGIKLHDEDIATLDRSQDVLADGAAEVLTIHYATPFTFVFYGKTIQAYSQAKTVGEMLKSKGITPASNDTLSPASSAPLTAGMSVQLWKNGEQTVTVDEDVPFETQQIQDANHDKGYKEVQTPGVNGKKTVTYKIVMQNGQEVSRQVVNSVTTKEAVKQVEVIGVKVSLPPGSHEDWMAAAGIAPGDYGYVNYIVGHEGGWCPVRWQGDAGCVDHGYAPSGLGYGLVQATPGGKMASAGSDWLTNPITQLRWATGYAVGRYGSWGGAYNHWLASHNW